MFHNELLMSCNELHKLLDKIIIEENIMQLKHTLEKEFLGWNWGKYALEQACTLGKLNVVKYLVEVRKVDIRSDEGEEKALLCASSSGHLDVVKYLIENGANARYDHDEALFKASYDGHLDIVKYLVENCKADVNAENGKSLEISIDYGQYETVKYLIDNGAKFTDYEIREAIQSKNGNGKIAKYLIEKRIEEGGNLGDVEDFTQTAIDSGNFEIMKYLVEKDVGTKLRKSLGVAVAHGYFEIITYLLEKEVYIFFDRHDCLERAIETHNIKFVKYLMEDGYKHNLDAHLKTACLHNDFEIVKVFVRKGANIRHDNDKSLKLSMSHKNLEIARFLIVCGCVVQRRKRSEKQSRAMIWYLLYQTFKQKWALRKIQNWWIKICYDLNHHSGCGKRMAERSWDRVEKMMNE